MRFVTARTRSSRDCAVCNRTYKVFSDRLLENNFKVLPIQLSHTLHVYTLPLLHCDPFDRILVAQSQVENLVVLTADFLITQYTVDTLW